MAHIALHRFEQVGDQVGAAFELHIDARPAFLAELTVLDEVVVEINTVAECGDDDREDDQASHCALLEVMARGSDARKIIGRCPDPAIATGRLNG
jgi:hypothetical protein